MALLNHTARKTRLSAPVAFHNVSGVRIQKPDFTEIVVYNSVIKAMAKALNVSRLLRLNGLKKSVT